MSAPSTRRALLYALAALLLPGWSLWPTAVYADSIKLGGFWFDRVTVQEIVDGKIVYTVSGTERVQPLSKVQGLKLTAFADSVAGQVALDAKEYQQVLARFGAIASQARRPWVRHWALWHKVAALDHLDRPIEAVEAYLQLVREQADPYFLATPPLKSLPAAAPARKKDLAQRLARAGRTWAKGRAQEPFEKMLARLKANGTEAHAPSESANAVDALTPGAADSAQQVPAVPLSSVLDGDDPITQLLRTGQFDQALAQAAQRLARNEPRLALRLYQQGLAQLHLARQSEDQRLYKDAGLSFMRVAIYFRTSRYTGPALVEAGLVHEQIGRHELALKLWRKAQVEIDPDTDPLMAERLAAMLGGAASQ